MKNPEVRDKINRVKARIEKLIEGGHLDEAKAALKKYNEKMPGDSDICSMLAIVHITQEKLEEAETVLLEGLQEDSVQYDLLYNLAYIHEQRGQYRQAADLYGKAATVADLDEQKLNIDNSLERVRAADPELDISERARIVFFVKKGMDNFLGDIINGLSEQYWVRKIIVSDFKQIDAGMEWADVCWFEWCDELVAYGSRLPLAQQRKIVCRLHRYEVFTDNPGKVAWENVDKLIIVAGHLRNLLEANFPGITNKVGMVVVENGVDVDKYNFKKRTNGFNLAMVGYIHSRKNPVMVLQIIQKLVKADKRYILYVAGQFQEQVIKLYWEYQVVRMGLEKNVIFEGWQKDISAWLEDKNYLVSTSIHESFGYGIAEAMARGIKPVIHDFLYANDIWNEKLLFSTVDEAVESIMKGQYESEQYRAFIEGRYSLKIQLKQINSIIKELLSFRDLVSNIKNILSGAAIPQELMREDITVLIPCYNRAKMLKDDLDRGFKLGNQPKLIVDDCSTNEAEWLEMIETKNDIYHSKIIRKSANDGPAQARFEGLSKIGTQYTTFIDDDDMLFCLNQNQSQFDVEQLKKEHLLVIPRYLLNLLNKKISLGYDRACYDDCLAEDVLRRIASESEIRAMLVGGAIGVTEKLKEHAQSKGFMVAEDFVMLSRMLATNRKMKIRTTESLVYIRRVSNQTLSKTLSPAKFALTLLAQAIACYYCLHLGIANKDEVLKWMKDRAALIQKLYNFGESFETELIAYLTGEISEEVFIHFIALHGLKLENGLDELAPELRMMRAMFYKEPKAEKWFAGMKDLPLVSIIIPTFNRRDMLKRAIDQVLKQDYPNIEVIVTDNCSEDGTEEMVRSNYRDEKRVVYNRNEKNLGPLLNYQNAFYGLARGKYCILLSDDDYLIDSSYICRAVKMLEKCESISFVFAGIYYNYEKNESVYRVKPGYHAKIDGIDFFINFVAQKYPYMPNLCTTLFRRTNALQVNILKCNPNCLSVDNSVLLRLLLTGNAGYIDDIVLAYTLHKGSISLNTDNSIINDKEDNTQKAVKTAMTDINEMKEVAALAYKLKILNAEEIGKWMNYRVWKYMYWRFNETIRSVDECRALIKFMYLEYPGLLDSLKELAVRRFGRNVLDGIS